MDTFTIKKTRRTTNRARGGFLSLAAAASATVLLAGCAGGVSSSSSQQGGGEGYEYGASTEEIQSALEGLDPVTISLQTAATSAETVSSDAALDFKEQVEEVSGGQVEVEIVWGMAVAGHQEVVDALSDKRLDISYLSVSYFPQQFPEMSALGGAIASAGSTPLVGEMIAYGIGAQLGWENDALLERYESEGVVPFVPTLSSGAYSMNCTEEVADAEGLDGKQVRIGSAAQSDAVAHLGGVPSSIEYTETYEALQRGAVDCDLSPNNVKDLMGTADVAPHLSYTTQATWPRFASAYLAGSSMADLPIAYQQILFDNSHILLAGDMKGYVDSGASHIDALHENGGTVTELAPEAQQQLVDFLPELQQESVDAGALDEATIGRVSELKDEWAAHIEELGYEDGGDFGELNEWLDREADYHDFGQKMMEVSGAPDHRPGA